MRKMENEHKRKFGRCEDAPCCGCCGRDYLESTDDFSDDLDPPDFYPDEEDEEHA